MLELACNKLIIKLPEPLLGNEGPHAMGVPLRNRGTRPQVANDVLLWLEVLTLKKGY